MPRDGSFIYSIPPGTEGIPDTTIESAKYNSFVGDVEQDLNLPRPIIAGGTGATSADAALTNLSGEKAAALVTNFDSHVWYPGSFRAAAGATAAPVAGHAFAGLVYIGEALATPPTNQNVVIHAYDLDPLAQTHLLYTRQKKAGVWGPWSYSDDTSGQAGARQAIYAAPFDALAYNGMQINGSMEVSQENGGAVISVSGTGKYIIDNWILASIGAQVVTGDQEGSGLSGLVNCLFVRVTTANASPAATDRCTLSTRIEGYRIARLGWGTANAQPITLAFWIRTNRVGNYSGVVANGLAANRSYPFIFTVNVANVWQYVTVVIPGDTGGTWSFLNLSAMEVFISMMAGNSHRGPAGAWAAATYYGATGAINGVAATSDNMLVSGVVVLPGIEAPSAERSSLIMRPYDQELVTCRRYYWPWKATGGTQEFIMVQMQDATTAVGIVTYPQAMRAQPTASISGNWQFNNTGGAISFSGFGTTNPSPYSCAVYGTIGTTRTAGDAGRLQSFDASATFVADGRL